MSDRQPNWDIDYQAGRQAEIWVSNIRESLASDSIEVKLDRRFEETGNIYIEYGCKRRGIMRPSGIATTTSKLWVQVLVEDQLALIISTDRLKEIARRLKEKHKAMQPHGTHPTLGVVIPVEEIIRSAVKRRPKGVA